jgi:hypothetical protein
MNGTRIKQRTLQEFELVESYIWTGGVITMMMEGNEKYKSKLCILCGKIKDLTHERLSGGQKTKICGECASRYVINAERAKERYENGAM